MPRQRSPNRDKAFEIYKEYNGNIDLVKIAEILNISPGTIRGWKNKDQWDNKLNGTLQKKDTKKVKNTERSKRKKNNVNKEPEFEEVTEILNSELTDKQRLFCVYYPRCFNATKAYQKAYECSYEVAVVNGSRLLGNAKVKEEIHKLKQDKLNRAMLNTDDIFQKYMDIAFADITDFLIFGQEEVPVINAFGPVLDKKGNQVTRMVNTVKFRAWANVDGTLISEVKQGKDGASIKLQDKMKALQWLSDRMDLLTIETQRKLQLENEKVNMAKERLQLDKDKNNSDSNETNKDGIKEFIEATTMTEEQIKELFKDDENEKEEET
ncbi:terminase small subunit [Clostridium pasteurianum]|uniref:Phage terminase, small subunit n=1 Tax=Clostridium pasteurianum BC1 TaxID=86416 RepID=R4K6S4_CLOPA|nr:terminase small subunit [Clostridium pasteurianum]AGK97396.1 phage terminase, small subunit [Clostridium pasteurianum BC1]